MEEMYTLKYEGWTSVQPWTFLKSTLVIGKQMVDEMNDSPNRQEYWLENSKGERVYPKEME